MAGEPEQLISPCERGIDALRELLASDEHMNYYDESEGMGTSYRFMGMRYGAGFAEGLLDVQEDGRVKVFIDGGVVVAPANVPAAKKLAFAYDHDLIIEGLEIADDGTLIFDPDPIDIENRPGDLRRAVHGGMNTLNDYAGAFTALEAGIAPWTLLDYRRIEDVDTGSSWGRGDTAKTSADAGGSAGAADAAGTADAAGPADPADDDVRRLEDVIRELFGGD